MAGTEVPIVWHGRTVLAWVPEPLADRDLTLSVRTARRSEQAVATAREASAAVPPSFDAVTRLLLRSEGVASSFIEGISAPLGRIALAEVDPESDEVAAWVADNLATVRAAIAEAPHARLTVRTLHRWHRMLMSGAGRQPPHLIGAFRDVQGWIGGTSPLDAALVTPPPDHVARLMRDLVAFANREDVDAVTQAAVAHAQLEVIHPYADGNGRIGRVLVGWLLTRRLGLVVPPPVSVRIVADRGGYLSGLTLFRLGQTDPWVDWFARTVSDAGEATVRLVAAVRDLETRWAERLGDVRADSVALRIARLLPARPVLAAPDAAEELGTSERSCRTALSLLAERGIVEPVDVPTRTPGRPRRWWIARELVDLVTSWSHP